MNLSDYVKSWVKGQRMTWTFSAHKSSYTHLDNSNYHFRSKSSKLSIRSYVLAFSHFLALP